MYPSLVLHAMTVSNPPSLPIARSKTAALSRIIDLVGKGYHYYCTGQCPARRLPALVRKFHERYGVACSPAQRLTRKQKGLASAALVVFLPRAGAPEDGDAVVGAVAVTVTDLVTMSEASLAAGTADLEATPKETAGALGMSPDEAANAAPGQPSSTLRARAPTRCVEDAVMALPENSPVAWLLLVTVGNGAVYEQELLRCVTGKRRLVFCGYELVRQPVRNKAAWTFRRTGDEMREWFALLEEQLRRRKPAAVAESLCRLAHQPGFAGVREQSWRLYQFVRQHGYDGELPFLYFVQKVGHGERLLLQ